MVDKYLNSQDELCLESLLDDICGFFTDIELEINSDSTGSVFYNNGDKKEELSSNVYVKDKMANRKPFAVKEISINNIENLDEINKDRLGNLELFIRTNINQILHDNMGTPIDFELQDRLNLYINQNSDSYIPVNISDKSNQSYLPIYSDRYGGSLY